MANTPRRQLGRVPDDEWETFREAAAAEGLPLSQWMRRALRRAAYHEGKLRMAEARWTAALAALRTIRTMPASGGDTPDSPEE